VGSVFQMDSATELRVRGYLVLLRFEQDESEWRAEEMNDLLH
jgi:hypothetical protein